MPQIREQIAMVHLPPSKTLKYLFHVRKTYRGKVHFAPFYFPFEKMCRFPISILAAYT